MMSVNRHTRIHEDPDYALEEPMFRRGFLASTVGGIVMTTFRAGSVQVMATNIAKTGFVPVNGLDIYYEVHGSGEPLLLLHGGLGAGEIFAEILPLLSKRRTVITADLQGHGRTADVDRPLQIETMASDIVALIKALGLKRPDLMGYSLGGAVALRIAIENQSMLRRLVLASTAFRRDGWYPEILSAMDQIGAAAGERMKNTPMYEMYLRIAPRPADWSRLLEKMGALLRKEYDWSEEVRRVKTPTLLAFGDADAVRTAHAEEFFELLGGGKRDGGWDGSGLCSARLAILPGLTHYNIFKSPALACTTEEFLNSSI
jgi:pimeloyl-ACP methyl ester carboxylesterase